MKKQDLSVVDMMVVALLKEGVPLMLGWDAEKDIWLEAVLSDSSCDDDPPFEQEEWLEYQVSDGLPGARSSCESYYTFEDAQKAFDRLSGSGQDASTAPPRDPLLQAAPTSSVEGDEPHDTEDHD